MYDGGGGGAGGGTGLKNEWGVADAAKAGSDQQAQQFKASFQAQITALGGHLEYTVANAEAALHGPLAARRDGLYPKFQGALGQIDPTNPAKAQGQIHQVLGEAKALNAEAAKLHKDAEKAKTDWESRRSKYDEAVKQVEELEAWEDPKAPTLRGIVDGIRSQVNDRKYAQASKTVDQLLPKIKPIYDEYLKQKEAKAKYDPAWEALLPQLTKACADVHVKIKPKRDELAAAQKETEASAQSKNYVQALQQVYDLAAKVEAYHLAVEELEKQKKAYEEAWEKLKPELSKAELSTFKKLESKQQEIAAAKAPIEASVQKEEYEEALKLVNDLSTKTAAYQVEVEALQKQKQAYEEAWTKLQPEFDKTTVSQFKKLAPLQEELTKIKGEIDAAVGAEDFEKALTMVRDLTTKAATYLREVEEAEKQKKAFEDAYAVVQDKVAKTEQTQFKKLEPKQREIAGAKTAIDQSAQNQEYEEAHKKVDDLSKKADEYLADVEALQKQKKAYEDGWTGVKEKFEKTAQTSQFKKLASQQEELTKIKGQIDTAAQADDYEGALQHVNELSPKVDAYLTAVEETQKKQKAYEEAKLSLEIQMGELEKVTVASLAALRTEMQTLRKAMEAAAEGNDYETALKHLEALKSQATKFRAEVQTLRQSIIERANAIETDMAQWDVGKHPIKGQIDDLIASIKSEAESDAQLDKAAKDVETLAKKVEQLKNDPAAKIRIDPEYQAAFRKEQELYDARETAYAKLEKAKAAYEGSKIPNVGVSAGYSGSGPSAGVSAGGDPASPRNKLKDVDVAKAELKEAENKLDRAYQDRIRIMKKAGWKKKMPEKGKDYPEADLNSFKDIVNL